MKTQEEMIFALGSVWWKGAIKSQVVKQQTGQKTVKSRVVVCSKTGRLNAGNTLKR